jgi:hypothetical protein
MAASKSTPLLNLQTIADRPTVIIDGTAYELRTPGELSLAEGVRLRILAGRIPPKNFEELGEEEAAELSQAAEAVVRMTLLAPDAVHERLTDQLRVPIMVSFIALSPEIYRQMTRATPRPDLAPPPTMASSSPGSRGSTGGRRPPGGPKRRSRSSTHA